MRSNQSTIASAYVTDTNALYWYLIGSPKLTSKAYNIFTAAEQGQTRLYVSVISLAELFYILRKNPLEQSFTKIYEMVKASPFFEPINLEPDDILDFEQDAIIPEMHDRMIVGLARRLQVPLITSDAVIIASKHVDVIW